MNTLKIGLVGIGKLGIAMMTHWHKAKINIGIYHPNSTKAEQFVTQFPNTYLLSKDELSQLDILILALPATRVIPFIADLQPIFKESTKPLLLNMATALETKEIHARFPSLFVHGVKYMGHSKDLMEHGNALFITEQTLPQPVEELYRYLGDIIIDSESTLTEVNKLGTYLAIKAAILIETEFTKKGFSAEYIGRALTSLAPEVIRGYHEGSLGHFAQEIVNEIKKGK